MTRLRICRLGIFFLFYLGAMMAAPAQDMVFRSMYNFNGSDGSQPEAKLVQATDGNFYGTTMMGGAGGRGACNGSCGTIFKITPAGVWIMLHSFDGFSGSGPYAGLVQAADGYLLREDDQGRCVRNLGKQRLWQRFQDFRYGHTHHAT